MRTYYGFIPGQDLTAEIEAPNTRHARTAFLDYLSRGGLIQYSDRGQARKLVQVTKMDPGEFPTTVTLTYGRAQEPEVQLGAIRESTPSGEEYQEVEPLVGETTQKIERPVEEPLPVEESIPYHEEEVSQKPYPVFPPSPIMALSKRFYSGIGG